MAGILGYVIVGRANAPLRRVHHFDPDARPNGRHASGAVASDAFAHPARP
jgi:hypothetical protein